MNSHSTIASPQRQPAIRSVVLFALFLAANAGAQTDAPVLRLAGVATVEKRPFALIEVASRAQAYHSLPGSFFCLQEGERADELELVTIDVASGVVKVRHKTAAPEGTVLKLVTPDNPPMPAFQPGSLHFENVPLAQFTELLGRLSGKTVLRGPVAGRAMSLHREKLDPDGARKAVEESLAQAGFKTAPGGERFVLLLRTNQPAPALPQLAPTTGGRQKDSKAGTIAMNLLNAPMEQVLETYGGIVHAKVTRGPDVPPFIPMSLKTQTPLTERECQFALETLLLLNGVKLVRNDDGSLQAVPAR